MHYFTRSLTTFFSILVTSQFPIQVSALTSGTVSDHPYNYNQEILNARVNKLSDRAKKCLKDNDLKGCIKAMMKLKADIELLSNIKIDLEAAINDVFRRIKSEGGRLYNSEMENIRDIINYEIKKNNHHIKYKAECITFDKNYDCYIEKQSFLVENGIKEDKQFPEPSARLMIGVTGTLCGVFILMVPFPIPAKNTVATFLITTGIKYCTDEIIHHLDRKRPPPPEEYYDEWKLIY